MKNIEENKILKAWHLAELITGGEVEDASKTVRLEDATLEKIESEIEDPAKQKANTVSLVYLGVYKKQDLRNHIQSTVFKSQTQVQNVDPSLGFSIALLFNPDWSLRKMVIPYVAYFYLNLRQNKFDEAVVGERFSDFVERVEKKIQNVVNAEKNSSFTRLINSLEKKPAQFLT